MEREFRMKPVMNKKEFLKFALKISFPIMVQNLINTLVNTADTVMLGFVSQTAMSASSLANEFTFVLMCIFYGLGIGTSVLCAQYYGKGDKKTIERVIGLATRLSILMSTLFFVLSFFFPGTIMRIFTNSPETVEAGIEYLRVMSFTFFFVGICEVYVGAQRSIGKVIFPSLTYVASLCVNVLMNATFIFGLFGFPKLGVVGVALGTVISRIVEVIICFVHSAFFSDVKIRMKYLFAKAGILMSDFLKICLPAIGNDMIWSLATTVFASILGHLGDDIVAANAVAIMVVNIGAIACRGFANATTIVVSQTLGENNLEAAKIYAGRMVRLTIYVAVAGCAIIVALRSAVCNFYADKLTPLAVEYLKSMIIMTTWRLVGEAVNTCLICGCFRGGGDTKYGFILDTVFMWGIMVPEMLIAAYVIKLPAIWVFFVMTLDEIEKMPVVFKHYFSFKWLKNITRDQAELEA